MTHSRNLPDLKKFEDLLRKSSLNSRCIFQVSNRLPKLIDEYESQPANRIGSRVKKTVRSEVKRTMKHLGTQ